MKFWDLPCNEIERGRKRKLSEADIDHDDATNPPPKKQRTSTSSNSNSNNSKAKSTKKAKGKNDKKKKKTYKGSDATEQIRKKMLETNRPWTASALRSEMNETIGIAQVKKSLAELHEDGILSMREFGKKKKSKTMVYWPDQDEMDDDEYDEMKTQQRIQELEHLVKQKRAEMNRIKSKCQRLQGQPTDAQIKVQMEEAWRNNETAKKEMADLEGDGNQRVSEKDKEDLLCQANVYLKAWKERMDKVWDMINMIFQDSADKPPKLLTGKIGGDTDKANGVDWNDYKEMYKESRIIVQRRKDDKKAKKR